MRCVLLWTHLSLLLVLILDSTYLTTSRSSCPNQYCGNLTRIQYPFGIGKGCYFNEWFEIQCIVSASGEPIPYLPKISKEVVAIDFPMLFDLYGSLRIKTNVTSMGCSNSINGIKFGEPLNFTGTPFTIGRSNMLIALGCNNKAMLTHLEPRLVGCISSCNPIKKRDSPGCNGYNKCCQAEQPSEVEQLIGVSIEDNPNNITRGRECRVAFLTDEFDQALEYLDPNPQWFYDRQYVILQLQWVIPMKNLSFIKSLGCYDIGGSYNDSNTNYCHCDNNLITGIGCQCLSGYTGNPYISGGCKDIDECDLNNKNSSCSGNGGTCVNIPGSYICVNKKDKTLPITIGLCVGFGVLIFSVEFCGYIYLLKSEGRSTARKGSSNVMEVYC